MLKRKKLWIEPCIFDFYGGATVNAVAPFFIEEMGAAVLKYLLRVKQ